MKRTIAPTTLVIVFATVFVLGILPRAQRGVAPSAVEIQRRLGDILRDVVH